MKLFESYQNLFKSYLYVPRAFKSAQTCSQIFITSISSSKPDFKQNVWSSHKQLPSRRSSFSSRRISAWQKGKGKNPWCHLSSKSTWQPDHTHARTKRNDFPVGVTPQPPIIYIYIYIYNIYIYIYIYMFFFVSILVQDSRLSGLGPIM